MSTLDLATALRLAIDAALEAGTLLRAEFHRAGGPRGQGDHAEIDGEIERALSARLQTAFPAWSWLGEETGSHGTDEAPACWIVDPHDGTRAFLEGHRGSSVSIALVQGGVPVLGVVYAPCSPDDHGDLFAWAEGQPFTRNGRPVERAPLEQALAAGDVVLVSQDADRAPGANQRCVAPARFRTVPSFAYRLALVAAGEGEAAVSLASPKRWDLAAGHALLRAVGGDVVDEQGDPVRYDRELHGTQAFGAHASVARALAQRPWHEVFAPSDPDPLALRFPLARPRAGVAVRDAGLLSRAQGCLLGQLAGDALGSLVEFESAASIAQRYPAGVRVLHDGGTWGTLAGQPTDDSEMALMLARCLVRDGAWRAHEVLAAYRAWRASGPFDIGGTTQAGLAGEPILGSEANGSLMRISPLAVFAHALSPDRAAALARFDSALTHPNTVCLDACAAFTVAVSLAVRTGAGPEEVHAAALEHARGSEAHPSVVAALARAREQPPAEYLHQQGWVLIALQNAFYQLLHAPDLEEGLVRTVAAGGDTDTNAAIAGALLGAVFGRDAVPARWQRALLSCRPLAGVENVRRPRSAAFWPVDALLLAEQLLYAGVSHGDTAD